MRVVVSEGKALWRYWWHAGTCVYDFRAAAPKGVAGRVSVSRHYAEPRGAEPRIPERLSSPCIAAYDQPENTVALAFVEGLNSRIREILRRYDGLRDKEYRRLKILTCTLPPLPRDHNA